MTGSGEGGKITKEDVERFLSGGGEAPAAAEPSVPEVIPFSGMRKAVADNMMASLKNAAQLTAFVEIDVTLMVELRDRIREEYKRDASVKISYNDIIICIAARALKHHPIMNSTLVGEEILLHKEVNMGMAVALPEGLIVPVLRDADKKGLLQIAKEARELADKARKGRLEVDEVTGGTFTISNTSMLMVDGFTPHPAPARDGDHRRGAGVKDRPGHGGRRGLQPQVHDHKPHLRPPGGGRRPGPRVPADRGPLPGKTRRWPCAEKGGPHV